MILLLLMYLQAPSSWVNELWIVQGSWNGVTDIHPWIDTTQTTHLSANNCFTPTYISLHPHHRHFTADNTVHFRPDRHANTYRTIADGRTHTLTLGQYIRENAGRNPGRSEMNRPPQTVIREGSRGDGGRSGTFWTASEGYPGRSRRL